MASQCDDVTEAVDDQIALVKSAFPGEIADARWTAPTRRITIMTSRGTEVFFHLDEHLAPINDVIVTKHKSGDDVIKLKEKLSRVLMTSSSVIVDLFEVARVLADDCDVTIAAPIETSSPRWVALWRLEHMRDRRRYLKHLRKFVSRQLELDTCDVISVMTSSPLVWLLVCGGDEGKSCDKLLMRIRTTKGIDVDSKGRGCKEKMLSVLYQGELSSDHQLTTSSRGFVESTFDDMSELEAHFSRVGLKFLFDDFIK